MAVGNVITNRKYWAIAITAFILPSLFVFSFLALNKGDFFKIENLEFSLEGPVNQQGYFEAQVKKTQQDFDGLIGSSIWDVSRKNIQEILLAKPWVEGFMLIKHWPSSIEVSIQISPVLFFISHKGKLRPYFANHQQGGEVKDISELNIAPTIEFQTSGNIDEPILRDAATLAQTISSTNLMGHQNIEKIHWSKAKGFRAFLHSPKTEVLLGSADFIGRAERVTQVLEYLQRHQIEARVIDSNFTKKVLVRLRNQL